MNKETDYLHTLLPSSEGTLKEMEAYARENRVPIMEKESMHFIKQLLRLKKARNILEIGSAIGYSAMQMAQVDEDVQVVSIERDEERYKEAVANAEKEDLSSRVRFYHGDALEISEKIQAEGPFDVLFIDAAKGQYQKFFEIYAPMLQRDAMILSDNVLFKNLVADPDSGNRRMTNIATKVRAFNAWLNGLEGYVTSIVPIGDGVAITVREGE